MKRNTVYSVPLMLYVAAKNRQEARSLALDAIDRLQDEVFDQITYRPGQDIEGVIGSTNVTRLSAIEPAPQYEMQFRRTWGIL